MTPTQDDRLQRRPQGTHDAIRAQDRACAGDFRRLASGEMADQLFRTCHKRRGQLPRGVSGTVASRIHGKARSRGRRSRRDRLLARVASSTTTGDASARVTCAARPGTPGDLARVAEQPVRTAAASSGTRPVALLTQQFAIRDHRLDLPQAFHDLFERLAARPHPLERQRRQRFVDDVQLRRGSRRDPARCRSRPVANSPRRARLVQTLQRGDLVGRVVVLFELLQIAASTRRASSLPASCPARSRRVMSSKNGTKLTSSSRLVVILHVGVALGRAFVIVEGHARRDARRASRCRGARAPP